MRMYVASEFAVALALSVRRTSAHPAGGVIVAVFGTTAIDAINTSADAVPAGAVIVSEPDVADAADADRNAIVAAEAGVPGVTSTLTIAASTTNAAAKAAAALRTVSTRVRRISNPLRQVHRAGAQLRCTAPTPDCFADGMRARACGRSRRQSPGSCPLLRAQQTRARVDAKKEEHGLSYEGGAPPEPCATRLRRGPACTPPRQASYPDRAAPVTTPRTRGWRNARPSYWIAARACQWLRRWVARVDPTSRAVLDARVRPRLPSWSPSIGAASPPRSKLSPERALAVGATRGDAGDAAV